MVEVFQALSGSYDNHFSELGGQLNFVQQRIETRLDQDDIIVPPDQWHWLVNFTYGPNENEDRLKFNFWWSQE